MNSDKKFGIVTRRTEPTKTVKGDFAEHYSYGVVVNIIEEKSQFSTLTSENTQVYIIEAEHRFQIKKIIFSEDDQIIKICEVINFKDDSEWTHMNHSDDAMSKIITETRDMSLKLLQ